jgi:hypothetical protein
MLALKIKPCAYLNATLLALIKKARGVLRSRCRREVAMLDAKPLWLALAGACLVGVIAYAALRREDVGQGRFFADQTYHFQTLRVLNDVPSDGADTAEVRLAAATTDRIAKGRALLRAHNYCRTAEFFLRPDDAKRPVSAAKNVRSFYAGLDVLGVAYQQIKVAYGEGHHLDAVYYPAAEGGAVRPLIVLGGGFDSTLEEL